MLKETTGELSMVIVTLVAIALIAAVVGILVPLAQDYVEQKWNDLAAYVPNNNINI